MMERMVQSKPARQFEAPRPVADAAGPLDRLKAVILLAGSVRPTQLSTSIGRSVMELPVDKDRSLLEFWHEQISAFTAALGQPRLPVRVMFDKTATLPAMPSPNGRTAFSIEHDPNDFRGTGGVLRDVTRIYGADDYVLVANGAQVLVQPLDELAAALASLAGDVAVVSHRDGTPSGLMLVRCGVLEQVSTVGFLDMKEQVLPRIAQTHSVRVAHYTQPTGVPIRSLADYVQALSRHHLRLRGTSAAVDPFAENLKSLFAIVQGGAQVDPAARLHDSVVLAGGRVDAGAILVRSIVCPGGYVRRDQRVVDRVIGRAGLAEGARR